MENLASPICSTLPGRHACRLGSSGSTGCCCVSSSYSTTDSSSSGLAFDCACPFFRFCFLSATPEHLHHSLQAIAWALGSYQMGCFLRSSQDSPRRRAVLAICRGETWSLERHTYGWHGIFLHAQESLLERLVLGAVHEPPLAGQDQCNLQVIIGGRALHNCLLQSGLHMSTMYIPERSACA